MWRWFSGSCGGATCVVGTGDAGVGPDACRIEMYFYRRYLILGYRYSIGEDDANSGCWRGGDEQVMPQRMITVLVPTLAITRTELGSAVREDHGSGYGER